MLKKLLPSLFNKEKSQAQSPLKNQPQPQQKLQRKNKEEDLGSDFNLISTAQQFYVVPKYATKLMLVIRRFIVYISIAFGVILILNLGVSIIINFQKKLQSELTTRVDSFGDVETRAKAISSKVAAYKKFSNERKKLLEKTKFVMSSAGSDIELKNVQLDYSGFTISFSGNTTFSITNLLLRLLEGDLVSEIVIRSASLDKSNNGFNVIISGNFK